MNNTYRYFTTQGPRRINEDSLIVQPKNGFLFAAVADGVGGLRHGEIASQHVVNSFKENFLSDKPLKLNEFVIKANSDLQALAKEELKVKKIATTFSSVVLTKQRLKGVHVGDSSIALIRNGELRILTYDFSRNFISDNIKSSKSNILYSYLGANDFFTHQYFQLILNKKDRIVLSTDGFHNQLSNDDLLYISKESSTNSIFYRRLENEMKNRILKDNATFISIEI